MSERKDAATRDEHEQRSLDAIAKRLEEMQRELEERAPVVPQTQADEPLRRPSA